MSSAVIRARRMKAQPGQSARQRTDDLGLQADPRLLLGRSWRRIVDERSLRADPSQLASFRAHSRHGDPPADGLVAAMAGANGAAVRSAVKAAFQNGLAVDADAPAEVVDFFAAATAVPYWVDAATVVRGQQAIARSGLLGAVVLGNLSLMGGYLSRRGIKPLMMTGELSAMAPRRLAETGAWWVEVTTPGSLSAAGCGVAVTLRVRLTHAHIRRWLVDRGDWNYQDWDDPVNQIHLAGTHLLFSVVMMGGLQRLGLHYDTAEREAIVHTWRYIGWLIGIQESLLPASEADGWRLYWMMAATELNPDDDSLALAQALLTAYGPAGLSLPGPLVRRGTDLNGAISRFLLGDQACDALGLPHSHASTLAVHGIAKTVGAIELGRRRIPGSTYIATRLGQRLRTAVVHRLSTTMNADLSYQREHAHQAPVGH